MRSSDSDIAATAKKTKISKLKVMQKYKPEWEKQYGWVTSDSQNKTNARCTICAVNFTSGSGGIGQIKQHQETPKHRFKAEAKKNGRSDGCIRSLFRGKCNK
ncbi:PREDICTED: uncharacterized protein LOC108965966 [Bactrocera latifrons]|uniref:uncharacterized protein LOC108965966 n=1 Tax=Bactrocera latifrons TaxID=174628 RepID=UPI0008DD62D1|nr:PREDICTED: uncharacterized protein LOC108965966 [Bactrocera latifrons]